MLKTVFSKQISGNVLTTKSCEPVNNGETQNGSSYISQNVVKV